MKRTLIFVIGQLIGIFFVGTALACASFVSSTPQPGVKLDVVPETIQVVLSANDHREKRSIRFKRTVMQATAEPSVEATPVPPDTSTVVPPLAPTPVPGTVTPVEPTVLIIDSPTNPGGPTLVDDDGARVGRMIALIVVLVTVVGLTAAVVFTRRRGEE